MYKRQNLPRVVSIQNAYNLVNRTFELGLSEFSHREGVGLLAYSPAGQGSLTGKYLNDAVPEGSRKALFKRFSRYEKAAGQPAIEKYVKLARDSGLDPVQMALCFVNSRPFLTSNIIGSTSMDQLKANIDTVEMTLPEEVIEAIDAIHLESPNPCP